ncbi:hypothetical protein BD626DRAFT_394784 [Schizophyllum amplum]|uniref:DNA replication factor Cdt1 C-terminal domain-containing protein n=1 Tax=Schizophyllum amplum TaxID=97359 RepID=A0A550CTX9_9AGAR|nr:hypothetical protein BD626DRAFT_394784 [Auriculariopsis ampla]
MADLYTSLQVSPRKKRCPPDFDDNTATPKKLRLAPPTPPATVSRKGGKPDPKPLPAHLSRLYTIQNSLLHALSHALATCAVSPSSDTGIVRNVLNHFSLNTYTGMTTQFDLNDLKRLCWLWEWDGKELPKDAADDDNPFLESTAPSPSASKAKDWTRGAMGIVVSPATHKVEGKRVPAYGIGIEVEMDIDKDMGGGMAAVARWTSAAESRRKEFRQKLDRWVELHKEQSPMPKVPVAELPSLDTASKMSNLTKLLASASPKGTSHTPQPPSSPTSPSKSPSKRALRDFAVPFPMSPMKTPTAMRTMAFPSTSPTKSKNTMVFPSSPTKDSIVFPQTPRHHQPVDEDTLITPVRTPRSSMSSVNTPEPSTPRHQRGADADTVPQTPTTSRRQALYERIRQKSLTTTPSKTPMKEVPGSRMSRDQMLKMGQEEMRRRCLLGRLGGVAESVWMFFSTPPSSSSTSTPTARKRRTLPTSEVAQAVIKSSPVPISLAEANESLEMLTSLCPFFLKPLNIAGEDWLEMPSTVSSGSNSTPAGFAAAVAEASPSKRARAPPSPSKLDSLTELVNRSPRRVKKETGGLREVREIIRRELDLQD